MDRGRKRKPAHADQRHTATSASAQLHSLPPCTASSGSGGPASEPLLVQRRLDMPHPGSSITTESRKRRRFIIASGAEKENAVPLLFNGHRRKLLNSCCYSHL